LKETDLIPQPHGGALRPFTSGTGAAAGRTPIRTVRREAFALLAEGTPEAAQRLLFLMQSTDDRVSAIACSQVLDRVLGKPGESPQGQDEAKAALDLSHLTAEERAELHAALATVHRLAARSALTDRLEHTTGDRC